MFLWDNSLSTGVLGKDHHSSKLTLRHRGTDNDH